jgi:hypothetical protein
MKKQVFDEWKQKHSLDSVVTADPRKKNITFKISTPIGEVVSVSYEYGELEMTVTINSVAYSVSVFSGNAKNGSRRVMDTIRAIYPTAKMVCDYAIELKDAFEEIDYKNFNSK